MPTPRPRNHIVTVRFNAIEHIAVADAAHDAGKPLATFVRDAAVGLTLAARIDDAITLICCGPSEPCDHDFRGYRAFEDGRGGEQVCTKCGMGAMEHSLREGI